MSLAEVERRLPCRVAGHDPAVSTLEGALLRIAAAEQVGSR